MVILWGCKEKIPVHMAKFSANVGIKGQVSFSNQSTDANSYQWDFGDGIGRSTEQNSSYTYTKPGRYTITLKATGAGGDAQKWYKNNLYRPRCRIEYLFGPRSEH
jgi:PKD repeat protein